MLRSMSRTAVVLCAGALVLSAYGLGSTPAFAKSKPTVSATKVTGVGTVLVDSKGKTLYTLTNAGQAVDCTGQCPTFWPPYLVKTGSKPKGGKGVTGLGTTATGQVTQKGVPLYRYSGDSKAGQANGEGISSFGGIWHVVKTASGGSSSPTPTTAKKSSSSGSSGY
jgi:predicted lipoprotein with Yx(FWY)xxD motif